MTPSELPPLSHTLQRYRVIYMRIYYKLARVVQFSLQYATIFVHVGGGAVLC